MVDAPPSLRCDEAFISPSSRTPLMFYHNDEDVHHQQQHQQVSQFCKSYPDTTILGDDRVLKNMLRLESRYLANNDHYQQLQTEIRLPMRKIVVEWMLEVTVDQQCQNIDVFLLAVNILDRFLQTINLKKNQLQLLGASSIFVASKMLEPNPIPALSLVRYTADTYDREELLAMELLILSNLKWDLSAITAYDYVEHLFNELLKSNLPLLEFRQIDSLRRQTEKLITLCTTDEHFLCMRPSLIASASLASAIQLDYDSQPPIVKLEDIFQRIQNYTHIEMTRLQNCISRIEELFLSDDHAIESSSRIIITTPTKPIPHEVTSQDSAVSSMNYSSSSIGKNSPPSEGYFSSPIRDDECLSIQNSSSSPHQQENLINEHKKSQQNHKAAAAAAEVRHCENATAAEVFRVSALCVT